MLENKDRVSYTVYYADTEEGAYRFQQLLCNCDGLLLSIYSKDGKCTANMTINRGNISKLENNQFLFDYISAD